MPKKDTGRKDGGSGFSGSQRPLNFVVKFTCEEMPLLETSTTAYDVQFEFHFPGAPGADTTPPRSQWVDGQWKKEYLYDGDMAFVQLLEMNGSMGVSVREKSCRYSYEEANAEIEKPKSAKKKKKPKQEAVKVPEGEKPPPERPEELDEIDFMETSKFHLQVSSFLMDSQPIIREFNRREPNGQPLPPDSLMFLRAEVTVSDEVMTPQFARELLPMQITIVRAEALPDKPFAYHEMNKCYFPVTANLNFPNKGKKIELEPAPSSKKKGKSKSPPAKAKGKASSKQPEPEPEPSPKTSPKNDDPLAFEEDAPPPPPPPEANFSTRTIKTDGLPHGHNPTWEHSEVLFLGQLDLASLASHFEQRPLTVEIHDRDISQKGLKEAAILTRGEPNSIAQMLMVSPEDDAEPEIEEPEPEPLTPPGSAKGSRKGSKKGKKDHKSKSKSPSKEKNEARAAAHKARMDALAKKNIRGIAHFRMTDLFRGSTNFELSSPILPLFPPRGTKLKPFQMRYNPYSEDSQLIIRVRLYQRLPFEHLPTQVNHTFNRMIFMIKYDNLEFLKVLCDTFKKANLRTLKLEDQPWTDLSTIRLTNEERDKMMDSDILTGVQVIDKDYRVFIIEGLATSVPGARAMAELTDALPRLVPNNRGFKMLRDHSISFYSRLYMGFDVDIKRIKLITPLSGIASTKNIHLNKKIPQSCYNCFRGLHEMQLASRLRMAKAMDLFPTIHELLSLEKWFGDFVNDQDLGLAAKKKRVRRGVKIANETASALTARSAEFNIEADNDQFGEDDSVVAEEITHRVDCYNPEYLSTLPVNQAKRDRIHWVKNGMKDLSKPSEVAIMKTKAFQHRPANVYELKPHDMPLEIDYEAMSIDDQRTAEANRRKEAWKAKEQGFRGTNVHEPWNRHPNKLPQQRVDDLQQPWMEHELHGGTPIYHDFHGIKVSTRTGGEFGMPGNPDWGKSVFVAKTAAGLEREKREAIEKERNEFTSKLVVDDPTFYVYRKSEHRKRMTNLDKKVPFVKGEVNKQALKYSVRLKNSNRKVGPITEHEPSMYTKDFFIEPEKALNKALLRDTVCIRDPNVHPVDYKPFYPYHPYTSNPHIKATKHSKAIQARYAGVRSGLAPVDPADLRPLSY